MGRVKFEQRHLGTKKKKKTYKEAFPAKQKRHHLVCRDGLQQRLNRHVHKGYLIRVSKGMGTDENNVMLHIIFKTRYVLKRTCRYNSEEMIVMTSILVNVEMLLPCLFI